LVLASHARHRYIWWVVDLNRHCVDDICRESLRESTLSHKAIQLETKAASEPVQLEFSAYFSHARIAIGLDYLGAAPVRGTRYGGGAETLTGAVKVDQAGRPGQWQSQSQ
jgi:hypothetical protein